MQERLSQDHASTVKTRVLLQDSYKLGCPAKVTVARYVVYPEYKVFRL